MRGPSHHRFPSPKKLATWLAALVGLLLLSACGRSEERAKSNAPLAPVKAAMRQAPSEQEKDDEAAKPAPEETTDFEAPFPELHELPQNLVNAAEGPRLKPAEEMALIAAGPPTAPDEIDSASSSTAAAATKPDAAPPALVAQAPTIFRRPVAPPAQLHRPQVVLSQEHEATCLVKVGDKMPQMVLPSLQGVPTKLASLYGDRMTLVVFWKSQYLYAREQFVHLESEAVQRYEGLGVSVVAVAVGKETEAVKRLAEESGYTSSLLVDPDKGAFEKMATAKLPRTYLLDAAGQVLWFDIEYSRSFRRELHNAVHYYLEQLR